MSQPANFEHISDLLWCGAHPDADSAPWLISQGVKMVINLEWEEGDADVFGKALRSITYLNLKDWEPLPLLAPSLEDRHIRLVLAAVRSAPGLTYIHCKAGQNRTRVAVGACQLFLYNMPIDAVIVDLEAHGGLWESPDANYLRSLDGRRAEFTAGT